MRLFFFFFFFFFSCNLLFWHCESAFQRAFNYSRFLSFLPWFRSFGVTLVSSFPTFYRVPFKKCISSVFPFFFFLSIVNNSYSTLHFHWLVLWLSSVISRMCTRRDELSSLWIPPLSYPLVPLNYASNRTSTFFQSIALPSSSCFFHLPLSSSIFVLPRLLFRDPMMHRDNFPTSPTWSTPTVASERAPPSILRWTYPKKQKNARHVRAKSVRSPEQHQSPWIANENREESVLKSLRVRIRDLTIEISLIPLSLSLSLSLSVSATRKRYGKRTLSTRLGDESRGGTHAAGV